METINEIIAILKAINNTLNTLKLDDKGNWTKAVGCMNAVDDVIKKLEAVKHDQSDQAE